MFGFAYNISGILDRKMAADGSFAKNILYNDGFTWKNKQKYKSELVKLHATQTEVYFKI